VSGAVAHAESENQVTEVAPCFLPSRRFNRRLHEESGLLFVGMVGRTFRKNTLLIIGQPSNHVTASRDKTGAGG
jgi:hypothetical protein